MEKEIKKKITGDARRQAPVRPYAINDTPLSMVHDLMVPYETFFKSPLAKLGAIKQGLQPGALTTLLQVTGVTQIDIAKWLDITEPTLRKHIQRSNALIMVASICQSNAL